MASAIGGANNRRPHKLGRHTQTNGVKDSLVLKKRKLRSIKKIKIVVSYFV